MMIFALKHWCTQLGVDLNIFWNSLRWISIEDQANILDFNVGTLFSTLNNTSYLALLVSHSLLNSRQFFVQLGLSDDLFLSWQAVLAHLVRPNVQLLLDAFKQLIKALFSSFFLGSLWRQINGSISRIILFYCRRIRSISLNFILNRSLCTPNNLCRLWLAPSNLNGR